MANKKNKKYPTSVRLVKKSGILLLKVWCSDDDFNECNYAVFKLTKEMKKAVIALKSVVDIVKGRDNDEKVPALLYRMIYWSPAWGACFLHEKDIEEKLSEQAQEKGDDIQFLNKIIEAGDELRIEVNLMHVSDTGIGFECLVKNTNIQLETVEISFDELGV